MQEVDHNTRTRLRPQMSVDLESAPVNDRKTTRPGSERLEGLGDFRWLTIATGTSEKSGLVRRRATCLLCGVVIFAALAGCGGGPISASKTSAPQPNQSPSGQPTITSVSSPTDPPVSPTTVPAVPAPTSQEQLRSWLSSSWPQLKNLAIALADVNNTSANVHAVSGAAANASQAMRVATSPPAQFAGEVAALISVTQQVGGGAATLAICLAHNEPVEHFIQANRDEISLLEKGVGPQHEVPYQYQNFIKRDLGYLSEAQNGLKTCDATGFNQQITTWIKESGVIITDAGGPIT
jgi:hypothetical protein